jgi:hypothetical protein
MTGIRNAFAIIGAIIVVGITSEAVTGVRILPVYAANAIHGKACKVHHAS